MQVLAPSLLCSQLGEVIRGIEEAELVAEEVLGERQGLVRAVVLLALVRVLRDPGEVEYLQLLSRRLRIPPGW